MAKIRITVVERTFNKDITEEFGSERFLAGAGNGPCVHFEEGQEFILERMNKPENFCPWAWADIHREIRTVAFDGGFSWVNQPNSAITCCTDGMKPVVFCVERIEEEGNDT
jgi:uncharacterized repeat protein (TIGR04076 family)